MQVNPAERSPEVPEKVQVLEKVILLGNVTTILAVSVGELTSGLAKQKIRLFLYSELTWVKYKAITDTVSLDSCNCGSDRDNIYFSIC